MPQNQYHKLYIFYVLRLGIIVENLDYPVNLKEIDKHFDLLKIYSEISIFMIDNQLIVNY